MFNYSDPTGGDLLAREGALDPYRSELHAAYREAALIPGSAFTLLDAFEGIDARLDTVTWTAFPQSVIGKTHEQIDADRRLQDEYVEWRVERAAGHVTRIVFTTEFPEYYSALAAAGVSSLVRGTQEVHPGSAPTVEELFGSGFNPDATAPTERARRLRRRAAQNPWVNGEKDILFMIQRADTVGALFKLVGDCAVTRNGVAASDVCGVLGNACVPERSSDPNVCTACQELARAERAVSLADPAGVRILRLEGLWKLNGKQVPINDPGG